MPLCSDCDSLITKLHARVPPIVHEHKNALEVVRSAPDCDLCNLLVFSEVKWQGNEECEAYSLSAFNVSTVIDWLTNLARDMPDLFPAIKVYRFVDIYERVAEVHFDITFPHVGRVGKICLAVWKGMVAG